MVRITQKKIDQIINFHLKKGIPFDMECTHQRTEIKSILGSYSNKESEFPANELNFIRRVKESIIKNEIYKQIPNKFKTKESKEKIHYYYVNSNIQDGDRITGCVEIDLKSAYWEAAYRMGLLSEEIYEQGKTISKQSRLAAIGSLAKVKKRFKFDGKKQKELDPIRSDLTEFLWDTICYKIGKLMYKAALACKDDFIFVWVDAMFVRKKALPLIKKIFKEAGYDFSIEKTEWISFGKSKAVVKGKGKWVTVDGKRVFKDERDFPIKTGARIVTGDNNQTGGKAMNKANKKKENLSPRSDEIIASWTARLGEKHGSLLRCMASYYPEFVSKERIGGCAAIGPSSKAFKKCFDEFILLELVEEKSNGFRLSRKFYL